MQLRHLDADGRALALRLRAATRPALKEVTGATRLAGDQAPSVDTCAASSPRVTAVSTPIEVVGDSLPVSFAAPRMVVRVRDSRRNRPSPALSGARRSAASRRNSTLFEIRSLPARKNGRFSGKNVSNAREVHLGGVRFDLAEVGIHRGVERQCRPEAEVARPRRRAACSSAARRRGWRRRGSAFTRGRSAV